MAVAHHTVASAWATQALGEEPRPSQLRGTNVGADAHAIQSYHWWEMARIMRTRGETFFLVNGDSYSPTTTRHQGDVRGAIHSTGLRSIIVPYTALDAAGIVKDSIRPLEIRDDRYEPYTRVSDERPPYAVEQDDGTLTTFVAGPGPEAVIHQREDGRYEWEDQRHILGDSLFMATMREQRTRVATEEEVAQYERANAWRRAYHEHTGSYEDFIAEHGEQPTSNVYARQRGGESALTVLESRERRARFLSSFDYNERHPLYFMCELPRSSRARTVDEAYEDLKPEPVKNALAAGIHVERQGDIFAIPTSLTTRELKSRARMFTIQNFAMPPGESIVETGYIRKRSRHPLERCYIFGSSHTATEAIFTNDGDVYARGLLYHDPRGFAREREHARRVLGDRRTWHRCVKNTVPAFSKRPNDWSPDSRGGAPQSGDSRAWTLGGRID